MRNFIAAVSLLAVACSGSPTGPTNNGATLSVRITDTPFEEAGAVLVTFDEVSVHLADGVGWMTVLPPPDEITCNLKLLEGVSDVLTIADLPAGHVTQFRLNVKSAALYDNERGGDACTDDVNAPVGDFDTLVISSGRVIFNRQFDLPEEGVTEITLDFDGNRSIRETGSGTFRMTPVISVVSVVVP